MLTLLTLLCALPSAKATDCGNDYSEIAASTPAPQNQNELFSLQTFQNQFKSDPKIGEKLYWFHYSDRDVKLGTNTYFSSDPIQLFPWGRRLFVAKLDKPQKGTRYASVTQELVAYKITDKGNRVVSLLEVTDISELKGALLKLNEALQRQSKTSVLKKSDSVAKDMDLTLFFRPGGTRERIRAVLQSWKTKNPEEEKLKENLIREFS